MEFDGIWWNLMEFGRIWWNLVEFDGIWWNLMESGGIWWNLMEFGEIWWIFCPLQQPTDQEMMRQRQINAPQLVRLEDLWKTNPDATVEDLDQVLPEKVIELSIAIFSKVKKLFMDSKNNFLKIVEYRWKVQLRYFRRNLVAGGICATINQSMRKTFFPRNWWICAKINQSINEKNIFFSKLMNLCKNQSINQWEEHLFLETDEFVQKSINQSMRKSYLLRNWWICAKINQSIDEKNIFAWKLMNLCKNQSINQWEEHFFLETDFCAKFVQKSINQSMRRAFIREFFWRKSFFCRNSRKLWSVTATRTITSGYFSPWSSKKRRRIGSWKRRSCSRTSPSAGTRAWTNAKSPTSICRVSTRTPKSCRAMSCVWRPWTVPGTEWAMCSRCRTTRGRSCRCSWNWARKISPWAMGKPSGWSVCGSPRRLTGWRVHWPPSRSTGIVWVISSTTPCWVRRCRTRRVMWSCRDASPVRICRNSTLRRSRPWGRPSLLRSVWFRLVILLPPTLSS